jgi:N-acetylmuramoyl-L-alanine amidase CwlA
MVRAERYEGMTLRQTELMLGCTQRFLLQNRRFKQWANKLCKLGLVDKKLLPSFDAVTNRNSKINTASRSQSDIASHCIAC